MKLLTQDLIDALLLIKPVPARRVTLPILSCIHLKAERNRLHLTATDLDQWQSERVECDGDLEAVCVNFNHLLNSVGSHEKTTLTHDGKKLAIKCGQKLTTLSVLKAEEFPALPESKDLKPIGVNCEDLGSAIKPCLGFESKDETRQRLVSQHLIGKPKALICEACDGSNMAQWHLPCISATLEALIPASMSPQLMASLLRKDAQFLLSEKAVMVKHAAGFYSCKQVEGKYPDTNRQVNQEVVMIGEIDAATLAAELEKCLTFSNQTQVPRLELEFTKTGLLTKFWTPESELKNNFEGQFEPHQTAVNCASFCQCLRAFKNDPCKVSYFESGLMFTAGNLKVISIGLRSN